MGTRAKGHVSTARTRCPLPRELSRPADRSSARSVRAYVRALSADTTELGAQVKCALHAFVTRYM